MKKKFLVILLALTMVFAFSATALATPATQQGDETIKLTLGNQTLDFDYTDSSGSASFADVDTATKAIESPNAVIITKDGGEPTVTKCEKVSGNLNSTGVSNIQFEITYTIDAQEYAITKTVNFYVGSNTADLDYVQLTDATGGDYDSSKVSPNGKNITLYVDEDASAWRVKAVAKDNGAKVAINNQSEEVTLSDTSFDIVVTPESVNPTYAQTYNVTVNKTFDVAKFTEDLKYNSAVVAEWEDMNDERTAYFSYPYDTSKNDKLTFTTKYEGILTAEAGSGDDDYIRVSETDNGFTVTFKKDPAGKNLDVDITLESRDKDKNNTIEFTLKLKEAEPVLLDDMNIQIDGDDEDIDYSMFPAKFDDETFDYYVFVPYDGVSSITVKAQIEYDKDFDVSGMSSSGSKYHKLGTVSAGKSNTFTIKVEEDDNSSNYTEYKIHVYYAAKSADDDDALDDIEVRYGSSFRTKATISPSFSANTTNYVVSLPAKTEEARLYLDASDRDAIILCNDEVVDNYITLSDLKAGENKFKVVVVAENCDDTKTYNITVNVGATGLLSNLSFSTNAGTFNFSPVFASGTYNYVANVPNSVTTLYVTPTAIDDDYTIRVYKGSTDAQTVKSGKTSTGIALTEGLNEVKVYVYQSGSSKTYTLNIYRQPTAPNYQVSVQNLYVNGTAKTLNAVNIKGNNFLKLRDLAYLLNGTSKQFNVTYTESTNTAHIHSLTAYVNDPQNPVNQPITLTRPQLSSQKVTLDGSTAYPIAYNVAGSNYVNLRQVCAMLDIGLTYSAATNTVTITTANSYTPGL